MRISDWSSDVCSSDLLRLHVGEVDVEDARRRPVLRRVAVMRLGRRLLVPRLDRTHLDRRLRQMSEQLALPRADFAQQRIRLGDIGSARSEEHTSELQSLMRISYAVFCLNKKKNTKQ